MGPSRRHFLHSKVTHGQRPLLTRGMRFRSGCERLTCPHPSSPPKSSPPPFRVSSSRRPALTARSHNSVPCCPVAPPKPPRRKPPHESEGSSPLPHVERWRWRKRHDGPRSRSEEHTSELQSRQ